jgi:hypothetical protein
MTEKATKKKGECVDRLVEPVVKGDVREVHLQMRCQLEPAIDRVERQTHLEQMTTYWNMKVEIKNFF